MSEQMPRTPEKPGVSYTRRQGLTEEILHLSREVRIGRIALIRALDALDLAQLDTLYDELYELSRPYDPRD